MTDYYLGIAVGALGGYCLSLFTMIAIWSLCVIAKESDGGRYDGESEEIEKQETAKRVG